MSISNELNPLKAMKKIKELNSSLAGKVDKEAKSLEKDKKKLRRHKAQTAVLDEAIAETTERKVKETHKKHIRDSIKDRTKNKNTEVGELDAVKSIEEQIVDIALDKVEKPKQKGSGKQKNSSKASAKKNNKKIKIIPLGGLEQIGMNITAFEYEDSIFVVDCGLAFPSEDMPGIDLVIPDVSYLKKNLTKLKGFCITHGHEDHIGALPYILKQLNIPVYGTKLTIALIERKLKEHNIDKTAKLNVVVYGQTVKFGDFSVEFVKTNHSIADAAALAIFSPVGTIFHTEDFKGILFPSDSRP